MSESSLEAEYEALSAGWGILVRPGISVLPVTGEDHQRFLQGLVTCDVKPLVAGQGAYGFLTNAKGHIQSDVVVRAFADRMWLELPESAAAAIRAHLGKYIVADRVEIHPPARIAALTLMGRQVAAIASELVGGDLATVAGQWSHQALEILGREVLLATERHLGIEAFTLWVGASEVGALRTVLLELEGPRAARAVSMETAEILRVEAGVPIFGRDFGPENLPQETGLEDEAVSYSKGCYLGQEVIARLHYRGQVARQIRRLRFEDAEPPAGTALMYDNREAGKVTSAVRSPSSGRVLGLAMIQTRAGVPGTRLTCESGGNAVVV